MSATVMRYPSSYIQLVERVRGRVVGAAAAAGVTLPPEQVRAEVLVIIGFKLQRVRCERSRMTLIRSGATDLCLVRVSLRTQAVACN